MYWENICISTRVYTVQSPLFQVISSMLPPEEGSNANQIGDGQEGVLDEAGKRAAKYGHQDGRKKGKIESGGAGGE